MSGRGRAQHRTGFILAGEGDQEVEFEVDRVILERSPVIRDWIERLSTPSETMLKDGALNLTKFDPQVVKYVIDVLGASRYDDGSHPFQYPTVRPYVESAVFYAKVYKLSKNLGVEELLSEECMTQIETRTKDESTFIDVAKYAGACNISEDERFKSWLIDYINRNYDYDTLMDSKMIKNEIQKGGNDAWSLFSVLMNANFQFPRSRSTQWLDTPPNSARRAHQTVISHYNRERFPSTPSPTTPHRRRPGIFSEWRQQSTDVDYNERS